MKGDAGWMWKCGCQGLMVLFGLLILSNLHAGAQRPATPSSLSLPSTDTGGSFTFSWGSTYGGDRYEIIRSGPSSNNYSISSTSYSMSGLSDGVYTFKVRACTNDWRRFAEECGYYSSSKTIKVYRTPGVSSSISVPGSDGDGGYRVSWSIASGTSLNYKLYESKNSGSWVNVGSFSTFADLSGRGNGNYRYKVKACNPLGNCGGYSSYSSLIKVVLPPGLPGTINLPSSPDTDGAYTLNWGSASGTVNRYYLRQSTNGGSSYGSWVNLGTASSKSYTGQSDGTYRYQVKAWNSIGGYGSTRTSATVTVLKPPGPPGSVTVPSSTTQGSYTISWGGGSGTVTRYYYRESTNGGSSYGSWVNNGTSTSKSVTGKSDGSYRYQVKSWNATAFSSVTTSAVLTVLNKPGVPSSLTVPATISGGNFTLEIGSATGSVTNYQYRQSKNGNWGSWASLNTAKTQSMSLTNGQYQYQARACNSMGCGGVRSSSTFDVITPPTLNLNAGNPDTDGSVSASWSAADIDLSMIDNFSITMKHRALGSSSWVSEGWMGVRNVIEQSPNYHIIQGGTNLTGSLSRSGLSDGSWEFTLHTTYKPDLGGSSSSPAVQIEVRLPPTPPSSLSVAADTSGRQISLNWGTASGQVDEYQWSNDGTWHSVGLQTQASTTLTASGDYTFSVRACNEIAGCSQAISQTMTITMAPALHVHSETPYDTNGSLSLSWDGDSIDSNQIIQLTLTGYHTPLVGRQAKDNYSQIYNLSQGKPAESSASHGNAADGTWHYSLVLTGEDGHKVDTLSESINVLRLPGQPGQPLASQASALHQDAQVEWSAGNHFTRYYRITRRHKPLTLDKSGSWSSYSQTDQTAEDNDYQPSQNQAYLNLPDGFYQFKVQGCNQAECGPWSTASEAIEVMHLPTAVTQLAAAVGSRPNELILSWNAPADRFVETYRIQQYKQGQKISETTVPGNQTHSAPYYLSYGDFQFIVTAQNSRGDAPALALDYTLAPTLAIDNDPWDNASHTGLADDIGELAGRLSVDANGSASYTLPLAVPPGLNGIQPELAIRYRSQAGSSNLGHGFSLSGVSHISRCPKTLWQDGTRGSILNDDDYRFCLDGQRLVKVSNDEYRTENESYIKIKASDSSDHPQSWLIYHRDGTQSRYGGTHDSRQQNATQAYRWWISDVTDVNHNRMDYHYSYHQSNGTHRLSHIEYSQNTEYQIELGHKIQLSYENRPDPWQGYFAGALQTRDQRLAKIEIFVDGQSSADRTYHLDYQYQAAPGSNPDPTASSRLEQIRLCFKSGACQQTEFDWSDYADISGGFIQDDRWLTSGTGANQPRQLIDIDLDGIADRVTFLHNGSATPSNYVGGFRVEYGQADGGYGPAHEPLSPSSLAERNIPVTQMLDMNGDGYPDAVAMKADTSKISSTEAYGYAISGIFVALAKADGSNAFYPSQLWAAYPMGSPPQSPLKWPEVQLRDLNGDGYPDVLRRPYFDGWIGVGPKLEVEFDPYDAHFRMILFDGSEFPVPNRVLAEEVSADAMNPNDSEYQDHQVDVNGDGRADLISSNGAFAKVMLQIPGGFGDELFSAPDTWLSSNSQYPDCDVELGDVNGDGLGDLALNCADGITVFLSTGEGFILAGRWSTTAWADTPNYPDQLNFSFIDLNQDGYQDILSLAGGEVHVHLGTGTSFVYLGQWANIDGSRLRQLADVNGDGFMDFATYLNPFRAMRVEAVTTSATRTEIDYRPLSDTRVYPAGQSSGLPAQHHTTHGSGSSETTRVSNYQHSVHQANLNWVVSTITRDNGIGGHNTTQYHYYDIKHDRLYGTLGFKRRSVTYPDGRRVVSEYHQTYTDENGLTHYHLVGQLKQQQHYAPTETGEQPVKQLTNQWAVYPLAGDIDSEPSPHYTSYIQNQWIEHTEFTSGDLTHTEYTSKTPAGQLNCGTPDTAVLTHDDTTTPFDPDGNLTHRRQVLCDHINTEPLNLTTEEHFQYHKVDDGVNYLIGLLQQHDLTRSDAAGTLISRQTKSSYDDKGQLIEQQSAADGANDEVTLNVTTTYDYTDWGELKQTTETWDNSRPEFGLHDANGTPQFSRSTTHTIHYTGAKRSVITQTPLHTELNPQQTEHRFDAWGRPTYQKDLLGLTTTTDYDAYGRPITVTTDNGQDTLSATTQYKRCGVSPVCSDIPHAYRLTHTKAQGQAPVRQFQDNLGRDLGHWRLNPMGEAVLQYQTYDAQGRIQTEVGPHRPHTDDVGGTTEYEYDPLGRITQKTLPSDLTIRLSYGNLKTEQRDSQREFVQTKQQRADGQLHWVEDANYTRTDYRYDAFGNLTETVVDSQGERVTTRIGYHRYGAREHLIDPSVGTQTDQTHPLGLLIRSTDTLGQSTHNTYDLLGRLIQRDDTNAASQTVQTGTWHYNAQGQLTQQSGLDSQGRNAQTDYHYSAWGDLTHQDHRINGYLYTHSLDYDRYRRLKHKRYPEVSHGDRLMVQSRYNDFGALGQLQDDQGTAYWTLNEADSPLGHTQVTLGNGTVAQTGYYNTLGKIAYQTVMHNTDTIQNTTYGYDELGNLATRNDNVNGLDETFCYDNLNRLNGVGVNQACGTQYHYDDLGNLIEKDGHTQTYGLNGHSPYALSQVTKDNQTDAYGYNLKGELKTVKRDSITQQEYQWSVFGKPTRIDRYHSDAAQSRRTDILYGPDRRRIERQDYQGGALMRTVHYAGDFEKVMHADGKIDYRHSLSGLAIITLSNDQSNETLTTSYLHHDPLGSLFAQTTTEPNQALKIEHFRFDAWGNRENPNGTKLDDPLDFRNKPTDRGFTGHEHLDDVNIIHMNGRVYSPETGRFLSPDPLIQAPTYSQSFNRYSYVWNNPLNMIDPSGYASKGAGGLNTNSNGEMEEVVVIECQYGEYHNGGCRSREDYLDEKFKEFKQRMWINFFYEMQRVRDSDGRSYLAFITFRSKAPARSHNENIFAQNQQRRAQFAAAQAARWRQILAARAKANERNRSGLHNGIKVASGGVGLTAAIYGGIGSCGPTLGGGCLVAGAAGVLSIINILDGVNDSNVIQYGTTDFASDYLGMNDTAAKDFGVAVSTGVGFGEMFISAGGMMRGLSTGASGLTTLSNGTDMYLNAADAGATVCPDCL